MLLRLLRRFLRPYTSLLLVVIGLQLMGTMASLYLPRFNAEIIDRGVVTGDPAYILRTGAWMLSVSFVQIVCAVIAVYFSAKAAMSFGRDVRAAFFKHVGEFSAREVALFGAPSLITRSTNDIQQVQMLVVMACTLLVSAPIMCIGGIIMAVRQDAGLSWLMVVAVPALAASVGTIVSRMVPGFRAMQARIDAVNRVLREQITGIRVVRAFVRERREAERFGRANAAVTQSALYVGRLMAAILPVLMLILNCSSTAVLWFGGHRVAAGQMQIGAMTAFLTYLVMILTSVMMATFVAMMVPRAAVCAERIAEVLNTQSSVRRPAEPLPAVPGQRSLEFRNVRFAYPRAESAVLKDVSFVAEAGKTTAIIGSTGSGKSTLVSLIPRLVDVTGGEVLIDGVDVRRLDPEVLWRKIGLVPQRPYLFTGTVATNLRYGNPRATDEQLWQALDVAQARGFVEAMPEGLASVIVQGGTNVSGGQRQRLCIARALVANPDIYLFDDSFSALDLATDACLRKALKPHTAHCAVVMVAQRVSTITGADTIIVLEHGEVVGRGNHEDLVRTCPTYAEIVESQLTAEDAA